MSRAAQISAYHAEYQRLTGQRVTLLGREWVWWEWIQRELTLDDLRLLIRDKQRRIRQGELPPQSIAFRNAVANADFAEEDILLLRARTRARPADPARAAVLRATGRPTHSDSSPTQAAGPIAARLTSDPAAAAAAFAEFQKLKTSL